MYLSILGICGSMIFSMGREKNKWVVFANLTGLVFLGKKSFEFITKEFYK